MAFFDVRSSRSGEWPAGSGEAPTFRSLAMPAKLQVPIVTHGASRSIKPKPIGTRVARGDSLIDDAPGSGPVPLAPADGWVMGLSHGTLLNGREVTAIDFNLDLKDGALPGADTDVLTSHERHAIFDLINKIQAEDLPAWENRLCAAGVWANRLTSPDFTSQLRSIKSRPVDTVLCSLLDDPDVRLNSILGVHHGDTLVAGVGALAKLTGAGKAWIVVDSEDPYRWWKLMKRMGRFIDVQVFTLRNDYPQADPTLMLYTLLNRRLLPGQLPTEKGVLMIDATTAIATGRCLTGNHPMLRLPLAIYDHSRGQSHFLLAPSGMQLRDALAQVGIADETLILRGGNVLRDVRLNPGAIIAGGELSVHVSKPARPLNPGPCVRCSWCVEGCPCRIQPAGMLEAAQKKDRQLGEHYGLDACIECGICSYVCPSKLPLLQGIRELRKL